ncbi:hypothetical protein MVEG_10640 [Podila verticillata NRRL 6337]|nr:hypothetical protein MVEG_10640 [Podila verticillata NRRL 6337]
MTAADVAGVSATTVGRIAHEELVHGHQAGEVQTYAEAIGRDNRMLTDPVSYSTVRRRIHEAEDQSS